MPAWRNFFENGNEFPGERTVQFLPWAKGELFFRDELEVKMKTEKIKKNQSGSSHYINEGEYFGKEPNFIKIMSLMAEFLWFPGHNLFIMGPILDISTGWEAG
jgi:hypothetical protein